MKANPVVRAARGGLSGRRVQAIVIGLVVFASTAASTLALGLLADSNAPFNRAFAAQRGADVTATVTGASPAELSATTRLPGVTGTAGPFPETTVSVTTHETPSIQVSSGQAKATPVAVHQELTLVGAPRRAAPSTTSRSRPATGLRGRDRSCCPASRACRPGWGRRSR